MFTYSLGNGAELKPLDLGHTEALYELAVANRDRLAPWFPWMTEGMALSDTRAFVESVVARPGKNDGFECCVFLGGSLVGIVGYHSLNHANKRTALGYWLGRQAEGKGLMTRAVTALLDHGFGPLGMNRIEICADPDNKRSRAVPERLGFELECVRKEYVWIRGECRDEVCYVMLASRWKGLQGRGGGGGGRGR